MFLDIFSQDSIAAAGKSMAEKKPKPEKVGAAKTPVKKTVRKQWGLAAKTPVNKTVRKRSKKRWMVSCLLTRYISDSYNTPA